MYNDSVNALRTDITFCGILGTKIENVDFDPSWDGEASEKLITSLNNYVKAIDDLKKQIDLYSSALLLMNEYIEVVEQIAKLQQELSAVVGDDRKAEHTRAMIMARIARLETRKNELKGKIDSSLAAITGSSPAGDIEDVNLVDTSNDDLSLSAVDRYIEVIDEIAVLRDQYNNVIGDELEDQQERGKIKAKISELEAEKKKLKEAIEISGVDGIDDVPVDEGVESSDDVPLDDVPNEKPNEESSLSVGDVITGDNNWNGPKLHAKAGFNENGPQAYETWYPLKIDKVVENMEKIYGHTNVEYRIREDGVRVMSGVTPDGVVYKDLVIVAADVYHPSANPGGTFQRGEIVETSLGTGIVADYCEAAVNRRKANGGVHFDIAAAWWDEPYRSQIYGND